MEGGGGGAGLVSATTGGDFIRRPIPSVEHLIMQLFRASGIGFFDFGNRETGCKIKHD